MDYVSKIKSEPLEPISPPPSPPPQNLKRKLTIKSEPPPQTITDTPEPSSTGSAVNKRNVGRKHTFTKEQDAYIIHLRQQGKKNAEVHRLFEEKFSTGRNPKSIENRYFAIKDECLLSDWEDTLLQQAISEIENDMSGAIIRRFKELSNGKSVTKGYVLKQMKNGGKLAAAKV